MRFYETLNCTCVSTKDIPLLSINELRKEISDAINSNNNIRILSFFALQNPIDVLSNFRIYAVLGDKATHKVLIAASDIGYSYDSLTPQISQLHMFEREIAEQFGIVPNAHPWLKPIRFHKSWLSGHDAWNREDSATIEPCVTDYFTLGGEEAHEVAVGPVHAGVIEPGHFRFQCMGEDVYHLEISLGYQHRDIEKMMINGPTSQSIHFAETTAGDTTIASAWNYSSIIEALSKTTPTSDSILLRQILLELERIANHVGDLGALAGDVAYLPTASFCGRIRGEYLNMTAAIVGNRFGRTAVRPGGTTCSLDVEKAKSILGKIKEVKRDLDNALQIMFDEPSVLDRFENTGIVNTATAHSIGLTGVAGRASGIVNDARIDFPKSNDAKWDIEAASETAGDVFSRANIRRKEIENSHKWLIKTLEELIEKNISIKAEYSTNAEEKLEPNSICVSVTEAWRGELVHVGVTNSNGKFLRYKIVDPSFRNWFGLALALRGEQISNFPICNKSFNLSYCGTDC